MKKIIICAFGVLSILVLFLAIASYAAPKIETEPDVVYPYDSDEKTQQEWIENKIIYLEKTYGQKIIEVKEDENWVTFTFETEYMSPKCQMKGMKYPKH